MANRFDASDEDFAERFSAFVSKSRKTDESVRGVVADIIDAVRERGVDALIHYTKRFDKFDLSEEGLRVSRDEIEAAKKQCKAEDIAALCFATGRIRAYHQKQLPQDVRYEDDAGVTLGWRWTSVDAAGLYAPGGLAAYPSSVLMNAIPAHVAGVGRLCLCVPAPEGVINPLVLAAAEIAGVDEVYRIGGAQAIAAMAYGASPLKPVDVIVGPGNQFVAEAKRQLFGVVGIDNIAGPSEILVVADAQNDPAWVAADLLSQAEHDPSSQSILITDDAGFAEHVETAIIDLLSASTRREIAAAAWDNNSAIIVVNNIDDAPALVDQIAPEHLELAVADPEKLLAMVKHAGAIFLGRHSPEAIGDYVAGPDHVLPTSGGARFASGLSVLDFMKRTSLIGCSPAALKAIGPAAARLADVEGLPAHAHSIRIRFSD